MYVAFCEAIYTWPKNILVLSNIGDFDETDSQACASQQDRSIKLIWIFRMCTETQSPGHKGVGLPQ